MCSVPFLQIRKGAVCLSSKLKSTQHKKGRLTLMKKKTKQESQEFSDFKNISDLMFTESLKRY